MPVFDRALLYPGIHGDRIGTLSIILNIDFRAFAIQVGIATIASSPCVHCMPTIFVEIRADHEDVFSGTITALFIITNAPGKKSLPTEIFHIPDPESFQKKEWKIKHTDTHLQDLSDKVYDFPKRGKVRFVERS